MGHECILYVLIGLMDYWGSELHFFAGQDRELRLKKKFVPVGPKSLVQAYSTPIEYMLTAWSLGFWGQH